MLLLIVSYSYVPDMYFRINILQMGERKVCVDQKKKNVNDLESKIHSRTLVGQQHH